MNDLEALNYLAFLPELILCGAGVLLMIATPLWPSGTGQRRVGQGALAALGAGLIAALAQWGEQGSAFFGLLAVDPLGHFGKVLLILVSALVGLLSLHYLERDGLLRGEFFVLLLFATVGMCLMVTSTDLIVTFLGLEILSIATYVLAGFKRQDSRSVEAALKYFLLGAFSTAFLLYGIAFVFGATGSTQYRQVQSVLQLQEPGSMLLWGLALLLVGFGFKIAAAPFHIWAPDVYEGSPVPVSAHLAVASKAAALVALLRVLYEVLPQLGGYWQPLLWLAAVLTMLVGNLAALTQSNVKRLLAYSSIAHAGYLLVGLTANSPLGARSVSFYLWTYALMTLGAFAVVQLLAREQERFQNVQDYAGLGFRFPFLSVCFSIFLISLAGIPATAGFMGKFFLFAAALEQGMYLLVILAVAASAVGLYYYLKIIVVMFMQESPSPPQSETLMVPLGPRLTILLLAAGTLYLGVFPGRLLNLAYEVIRL